jgi:starch synthase
MEMAKTKLLIVTHEMSPFLELTKISEITRQLPQAMQEKGFEIRILMPKFGNINERRNRLHEVIRLSGMNIIIDDNDNPLIIKVASIPSARMQVYFLDNEDYFHRKYVFRDKENKFYADNDERTIFFCKGLLESLTNFNTSLSIFSSANTTASECVIAPMCKLALSAFTKAFVSSSVIFCITAFLCKSAFNVSVKQFS